MDIPALSFVYIVEDLQNLQTGGDCVDGWSKEEFRVLYDRYVDMLYKICMVYLKNESDAKDGVQEIFLKLWEKKPSFSGQEHEKAWLIRLAKNYCINQLRSHWFRKRSAPPDWSAIPAEETEEDTELLELVMSLPVKFREVLYLYYYEEYSVREISRLLGRKESTLQSRLAAGREKLKERIKDHGLGAEYGR